MFQIIQQLLESPEAMYTHINLSNGNSTAYPMPGYVRSLSIAVPFCRMNLQLRGEGKWVASLCVAVSDCRILLFCWQILHLHPFVLDLELCRLRWPGQLFDLACV
eukprot:2825772-Rhodomonas_salina.1